MEHSKAHIIETQIKALRELLGKSRLESLNIILNQMKSKDYIEELIIEEKKRLLTFRNFLDNKIQELMDQGYTRLQSLQCIKELLDKDQGLQAK